MPKIAIIDTYYPDFLESFSFLTGDYHEELARLLAANFGTSDFYSRNLKNLGWDVVDIVGNARKLQRMWSGALCSDETVAEEQLRAFSPDVVFMQDLSFFNSRTLSELSRKYLLAGQCSCPMPAVTRIVSFKVLFTSFPHYVDIFAKFGVRAEYLPLAFEASMRMPEIHRDLDIVFVGGVGKKSHWYRGTGMLEFIAEKFGERFHWYGYGLDNLPRWSPLRQRFCGTAWGREMYKVYHRAKIVVNRHGEVAGGHANNLRMYEATGSGAMLITEAASNLADLFPAGTVETYQWPEELCEKIVHYLDHDSERYVIANAGKRHTLHNHTYEERMARVSEVLTELLI